jgi:tetratricopeptide (TPR) repeat protein
MSKRSRRRPAAARPAPPVLTLSNDLSRWLAPAVLVLVTAVAYLPTFANGFVNFDDIENFINNRAYRGLGWTQLRWMFTTWNLGGLIPLTWITLGFDYVIWGMDPAGYHLTTLVLHLLGSLVFYFVLLRLFRIALAPGESNWTALRLGALVGALLFSVHPLRVESVAWITERRDVLSGLFTFLSVLAYLRAWDARRGERLERRWYLASLAFFACAILSKAMAVTLPVVLVLLDVYPLRRLPAFSRGGLRALARNLLVEKWPFGCLALAGVVVTVLAARGNDAMSSLARLALLDRLFLAVHSAAFYLWKTVAPINLSIMYQLPERLDRAAWPFIAAWVCVLAVSAVCLALARRFPAFLVVWIAYLVMLAPVSGLTQAGWQMTADRYSYMPCLGWAALAGAGFLLAWQRAGGARGESMRARTLVAGTAVCLISVLGVLTWRQVGVWRDTETLWTHAAAASPSSLAHENLGEVYQDRGQFDRAAAHFEQSVRMRPGYGPGHFHLGATRAQQGRPEEAMREYEEAARLMPDSAVPYYNMGLALVALRRPAEAIERYRQALKIVPGYADAHNNLGLLLAENGKLDEGVTHLREAVALRPDSASYHSNLGLALARQGRAGEALRELAHAVDLDPRSASAHNNLGVMLISLGRYDDAAVQFREALAISPGLREAQVNLEDAAARAKRKGTTTR